MLALATAALLGRVNKTGAVNNVNRRREDGSWSEGGGGAGKDGPFVRGRPQGLVWPAHVSGELQDLFLAGPEGVTFPDSTLEPDPDGGTSQFFHDDQAGAPKATTQTLKWEEDSSVMEGRRAAQEVMADLPLKSPAPDSPVESTTADLFGPHECVGLRLLLSGVQSSEGFPTNDIITSSSTGKVLMGARVSAPLHIPKPSGKSSLQTGRSGPTPHPGTSRDHPPFILSVLEMLPASCERGPTWRPSPFEDPARVLQRRGRRPIRLVNTSVFDTSSERSCVMSPWKHAAAHPSLVR